MVLAELVVAVVVELELLLVELEVTKAALNAASAATHLGFPDPEIVVPDWAVPIEETILYSRVPDPCASAVPSTIMNPPVGEDCVWLTPTQHEPTSKSLAFVVVRLPVLQAKLLPCFVVPISRGLEIDTPENSSMFATASAEPVGVAERLTITVGEGLDEMMPSQTSTSFFGLV